MEEEIKHESNNVKNNILKQEANINLIIEIYLKKLEVDLLKAL